MKTPVNAKPFHNPANPSGERSGVRASAAKTFEHCYERRKIHAQLRRLDWALIGEDEILA